MMPEPAPIRMHLGFAARFCPPSGKHTHMRVFRNE